jgi:peptidoglycan/xylan/chitin deacetylase (PgdA/CDA1 family)
MYHGVVSRDRDRLLDQYAIDVQSFRSHLAFLRQRSEVVPLSRIIECVSSGAPVPRAWVAITLDDALASQVTTAAEALAAQGMPWALAAPAGLIETGRSVWTYEFRFLLLECWPEPTLPWPSEGRPDLPARSVTERREAVRAVLPHLFEIPDDRRAAYLEQLIDRAGRAEFLRRLAEDGRFVLATWAQLRSMRDSGVEVLSHGWHHRPQNPSMRREALVEEIERSRALLGQRLGVSPAGFALPHGARAGATDEMITAAGYKFCLSSRPERVTGVDRLRDVPRFSAEYPLAVLRRNLVQHR